ncbi:baseplate multidomain protein megatron [Rhodoligotrophos defluvii]|uniref:baseplate multidomain protein megatron n=1 Tax=Rhodoligotrophos defluvii TaxID=2561934 RepID=UPI0010C97431|nr:glycoside hydrolase TIM-barrel-like domain-containing protein [Rhodoligotrophos defluvii]
MASILLTTAASALGSSLGLNAVGQALLNAGAAIAGSVIDNALFGGGGTTRIGPRLTELDVLSATEGSPIPRAYGRARLGGQMIWATRLEEEIDKDKDDVGGVFGVGGQTITTINYRYYANFAVALCEGEIAHVNRVWADGKELDLNNISYRVHAGSEDQLPDALLEAKEGAGNMPAYRGIAYVVFERLPLERFGNRIPQLNFEVFKPLPGRVEERILGVNLIPGATEFGYEPQAVKQVSTGSWGAIFVGPENRHVTAGTSDWSVSLDHLAALLPNLKSVNLVVAWFGDDLRCGSCTVRPKVDNATKDTMPIRWRVAGLERQDAEVVSLIAGRPAYGGTPNDASVIAAIQQLKARGYYVILLPFLMMDVPADNALPDPHTGGTGQPAYPWRGRIACDPAPGQGNALLTTGDLSGWTLSNVSRMAAAGTMPDGIAGERVTLTDSSGAAGGFGACSADLLAGKRVTVSAYVLRDEAAAHFPALRVMTRLGTHTVTLRYNPDTDQLNVLTAGAGLVAHAHGMESAGDFRRLWVDLEDPGGTMLRADLFPAFGLKTSFPATSAAATGSASFAGPQITRGRGLKPYWINLGTTPLIADLTAEAAAQVDVFVGTAGPGDFSVDGSRIDYAGPAEWSYRRFILHYAALANAAGVDALLIGSEMVGLSQVRDAAGQYPFVQALMGIAADARTMLGPAVAIGYAADWSEYHSHRPDDGSGDVIFHLDPLWADANVDFIGIDNYLPLSDWREGRDHLDYDPEAGIFSIYDHDYLERGIEGGEYYDWYYVDEAARRAQLRTPITDGAGKPWVFRNKDIRSWWDNPHYDRPGGVEAASPTAWVPRAKPLRFTECGCPAIDKGTNRPNLFFDAKSSESGIPPFSTGGRDDEIQRAYLDAMTHYWDPASGNNPAGPYGGAMVDADKTCVWAWDARPFPTFPIDRSAWGDAENWPQGHWISSRATAVSLADLVQALGEDYSFDNLDTSELHGTVDGYVLDSTMSLREALEPLGLMFGFDAVEAGAKVRVFSKRGTRPVAVLDQHRLVEQGQGEVLTLTRRQETELPEVAKLRFIEGQADYRTAAVEARRVAGFSARVAEAEVAVVIDQARAQNAAETWLQDLWVARDLGTFALPPSLLALEPGDLVTVAYDGEPARDLRINRISELTNRACEAQAFDEDVFHAAYAAPRHGRAISAKPVNAPRAAPALALLDLPRLRDGEPDHVGYAAAFTHPWPGAVNLYRSASGQGYSLNRVLAAPAAAGETVAPFGAGPTGRWDNGNVLEIRLYDGQVQSRDDPTVFAGANLIAVESAAGRWELLQFASAELIAPKTWRLTRLLRAQAGTDGEMADIVAPGTRCLVIDAAVVPVNMQAGDIGLAYHYRAGPAGDDLGGDTYTEQQHAFSGMGLRPLSPVHIRGRRLASGDVELRWIRRTRAGGDSWHMVEVPLAEEREAYEIDVLDGADAVKRTITAPQSPAIYTASAQLADFGSLPGNLTVMVYQISAAVGRGTGRRAAVQL